MNEHSLLQPTPVSSAASRDAATPLQRSVRCWLSAGCLAMTAIATTALPPALAVPDQASVPLAQALPTPLPPIPYASNGSSPSGEHYLVLINGNSDLLLEQVRQVEPGAFVNYVDGASVIQAGRFSSYQNAQMRVEQLAMLGIGAEVKPTTPASAPIAVTAPPMDYGSGVPVGTTASLPGDLPPLPVAATPSSVEFGQAPPFQTVSPPPAPSYPAPASPYPPTNTVAPPPLSTPPIAQERLPSGYYVVIPAGTAELPGLVNQVVGLGAPVSLVHTRTAPRGPHVAVGPYNDHGIAQEWSNYLRDSGLGNARVHFE